MTLTSLVTAVAPHTGKLINKNGLSVFEREENLLPNLCYKVFTDKRLF